MNDIINALFEFFGGCFLWLNVRRLLNDKQTKGVSIPATAFFAAWGIFNLYFYPSVGAWWSCLAGINVVVANIVWVTLMVYYARRKVVSSQDHVASSVLSCPHGGPGETGCLMCDHERLKESDFTPEEAYWAVMDSQDEWEQE